MSIERNIEIIKEGLDTYKLNYRWHKELNLFDLEVSIKGTIFTQLHYFIFVHDKEVISYTMAPISVNKESIPAAAEFIIRVNYLLDKGNFDMDFNDGTIRFRNYVTSLDNGEDVFNALVTLPYTMYFMYGNRLLQVINGGKSPTEALKDVKEEAMGKWAQLRKKDV